MTRLKHQQPVSGGNIRGRSDSPMARSRSPKGRAPMLPPVKELCFLSAPPSSNGIKNMPLSYQHQTLAVTINRVYSPFEPSSFVEGGTRLTLTVGLPKEWDASFDCFEACLIHEVAERSDEFFGRPVAEEEVQAMYKPISKKTGDFPRTLRTKLNMAGTYRVRYWSTNKEAMDAPSPQSHAGMTYNARVALRGLWFGEHAWGVVAECTDLQLTEEAVSVCPF